MFGSNFYRHFAQSTDTELRAHFSQGDFVTTKGVWHERLLLEDHAAPLQRQQLFERRVLARRMRPARSGDGAGGHGAAKVQEVQAGSVL